jgi:hypothetical protein
MRPCRVKEAWGRSLRWQTSRDSNSVRNRVVPCSDSGVGTTPSSVARLSRDYRASAADRDSLPKTKPFIYQAYKFVLVRQSPRREA